MFFSCAGAFLLSLVIADPTATSAPRKSPYRRFPFKRACGKRRGWLPLIEFQMPQVEHGIDASQHDQDASPAKIVS